MKKMIWTCAVVLALTLTVGSLVGCTENEVPAQSTPTQSSVTTVPSSTTKLPTTTPTTYPVTLPTMPTDPPTLTPTTKPSTKPTTRPTTRPSTSTPTTPSSVPSIEETTYEDYTKMSGSEQLAFIQSFESMDAFFNWYNTAKQKYDKENAGTELNGGSVDLGDLIGGGK